MLMRVAVLLPVLLSSVPVASVAQEPPAARGDAGLSLTAFSARRWRRLRARDTDGDGRVSRAEFLAGDDRGTGGRRSGGDPATRFAALDRHRDGAIGEDEMNGMAARRFARLDADGDGVLTAAERTPRRRNAGGAAD